MNIIKVLLLILVLFSNFNCMFFYMSVYIDIGNIIKSLEKNLGYSPLYLVDCDIYKGLSNEKNSVQLLKQIHFNNIFIGIKKYENNIYIERNYFISYINSPSFLSNINITENSCRKHGKWFLFFQLEYEIVIQDFILNGFFPIDCYFILIKINPNRDMIFKEIYNVISSTTFINNLGNRREFLSKISLNIHKRRANFQNAELPIVTSDTGVPVFIVIRNSKQEIIEVVGLFGEVWKVLEEKLYFRSHFLEDPNRAWGKPLGNGSWDGMLGIVHRGEARASLGDYSFYRERLESFDFLLPFIFTRMQLYIKAILKKPEGDLWFILFKRFNYQVWFLLLSSIICFSFFLTFFKYKFPNSLSKKHSWSFFEILGLFCFQAPPSLPKQLSFRILFICCQFLSLIIMASFSAYLISSLTVVNEKMPFKNFPEMLQLNNYRLGVIAKSGQLYAFQNMKDPTMKKIYEKFISPDIDLLPYTNKEGLIHICEKENYAFMSWDYVASSLLKDLPCQIQSVSQASLPDVVSIIFEKNSHFTHIFNYYIIKMKNGGIIERLKLKDWGLKKTDFNFIPNRINFGNIFTLFYILISGITFSLLIIFLEILFNCMQRRT